MKIEKSIDMPSSKAGRSSKYPFSDMEVGDSVFFEGECIGPKCKPYIAAQTFGLNHGSKFSGRTVEGGVRIWRVK